MNLLALSRAALAAAAVPVASVTSADLSRPTPCGSWSLAELLGHMVAHNLGWAASAAGTPVGVAVWDSVSYPASDFAASASAVTAAFAASVDPMEVYGYGRLRLSTALRMHIVDYVIHGWDVAASLGLPFTVDTGLAEDAYQIMLEFPDGPRPSKAFGVKVPVPSSAPVLDQFLGYLGRDPEWRPT